MDTMTPPLLAPAGAPAAVAATEPGGPPVTYGLLARRSALLAERLAEAGLRPGDRIATLTDNSIDQVVLFYACARTGLVLVPLSWRLAAAELAVMLADAQPALLAHSARHVRLASTVTGLPLVRLDHLEEHLPRVGPPRPPVPGAPGDPVLLLFTSGSSGHPKGVPLSMANCLATNAALDSRFPVTAEDTVLLLLPQFHVAAWNVQPLLAWSRGARVVVLPRFDSADVLDAIEADHVTTMMGVPSVYRQLAAHPGFHDRDLRSLRTVLVGGAPVDPSLGRAWAAHGIRLWAGYGLTEAGPNVLCEPPEALTDSAGWMAPYDGVQVALDDAGQLLVRSPGVFAGYWRNDEATRLALRNGWLATGDLVEQDGHGHFRVRGRTSDMYISGGENVHPAEVEEALRTLPAVAEAAVLSVPDDKWGEVGVAFVVPVEGTQPTPEELRTQLRHRIAGFKVPRELVIVDALPQTGSGKVDRRALRSLTEGSR